MKINKNKTYYLKDFDGEIKQFVITEILSETHVKGYIIGENQIHVRDISWLQDNPNKLKHKYKTAMKYYKKYGNKNIGTLNDSFVKCFNATFKHVLIIGIKNYNNNLSKKLVSYINPNGIVETCDLAWFEKINVA